MKVLVCPTPPISERAYLVTWRHPFVLLVIVVVVVVVRLRQAWSIAGMILTGSGLKYKSCVRSTYTLSLYFTHNNERLCYKDPSTYAVLGNNPFLFYGN
jgi:hypothetical protein